MAGCGKDSIHLKSFQYQDYILRVNQATRFVFAFPEHVNKTHGIQHGMKNCKTSL